MAPVPYHQGALDGFCGVYSVINAIVLAARPLKRLTKADCLDLFAFLVCALRLNGELPRVLISGGYYPTVSRLLKVAHCWLVSRHQLELRYRRPFHNRGKICTARALHRLGTHLKMPGRAGIIRVTGASEHWTVVRSVSAKTGAIHFSDSGNYRYIRKRSLRSRRGKRAIALVPRDVILVSVAQWIGRSG